MLKGGLKRWGKRKPLMEPWRGEKLEMRKVRSPFQMCCAGAEQEL